MKVALDTLGCKLNQAETEKLARQFLEAGYCLVPPENSADVYILNTCTVTSTADSKARRWLRLMHRRNPGARLVVTGCYAQRQPDELAQIEGVSLVVGNNEKPRLLQLLQDAVGPVSPAAASGYPRVLRTRTFINIQDGCSQSCSYCIVPMVRGQEKSQSVDDVIAEVKKRVDEGYQEVILTGTEIGAYHNGLSFTGLLGRILVETSMPRLRLSSLQPQEISSELLELWRDSRLCPHFHLSLQSGNNRVLRCMRRAYSTADYERIVCLIRDMVPDAAITTDIIVGFPSETEEEFAASYDFCRKLQFARIHVFSYSSRPDTEASRMSGQISLKVKEERSRKMLALSEESSDNFRKRFLGKVMTVLWQTRSDGVWSGFTGNYIKAYTKSDDDLTNKLVPVKLS